MKFPVDGLDDNIGERPPDIGPDARPVGGTTRPVGGATLAGGYCRHATNSIGRCYWWAAASAARRPVSSFVVFVRKTFGEVLDQIADVEGWLTEDQARRLYDRASELREDAQLVEIGSFRGRSLIVLASAAPVGVGIVSIDPHAGGDRGPQEIAPNQYLGDSDYFCYIDNLTRAGVADRVTHIRKTSGDALGDVDGDIDLLYIDGAHRFGPARQDIVAWGDQVTDGGTMLIHDSFSSIGVTLALLTSTFVGSPWRYQGRSGSLAEYRREPMSGRESTVNALRQALQLGWFARNVLIKGALTLKLYPLARLLGHRTRDWPY